MSLQEGFNNRFAKRGLSWLDKRSIENTSQKALIMPSAANTEIEELILSGFDANKIVAVEKEISRVKGLYNHYKDNIHIVHGDVNTLISEGFFSSGAYSYIHLDYYGYIHDGFDSLMKDVGKLLNVKSARIRISNYNSRKSQSQLNKEAKLQDKLFSEIIESLNIDDALLHELINMPYDSCFSHLSSYLRQICGLQNDLSLSSKVATNFVRWHYREQNNKNIMITTWCDVRGIQPKDFCKPKEDIIQPRLQQVLGVCPLYLV